MNKVEFIKELTEGTFFGDPPRPFFNHLNNVSQLIAGLFPEEQHLIDAGLYHSVYGTSYFHFESDVTRKQVQSLIGEKAENLVHVFCSLERRSIQIVQHKFPLTIQKDLYILEYVNLLEASLDRVKNLGKLNPLTLFLLQLIRSNLKDHYSIVTPPLPFEAKPYNKLTVECSLKK